MKNKKNIKILAIIGLLIIIPIIIFLVKDLKQEEELNNNIVNYVENNVINENSITTGEYRKIEDAVMGFLISTNEEVDKFTVSCGELENFDFYSVDHAYLSLKDDFKSDKEKLDNYEKEIMDELDKLIELNTYDNLINKYKTDDSYYNDLYKELIGEEEVYIEAVKDYTYCKNLLSKYFDLANRYIDFLQNSSLVINEDKANMLFYSDEEVNMYNNLIEEIGNINLNEVI